MPAMMPAGDVEALARASHALHAAAVGGRRSPSWGELTGAEREANLDSARFAPLLVAALGLEVHAGVRPDRRIALTDEELDAGARLEHLRWCRFTLSVGRRDHPDLLPWGALSEEVRELDRLRVRALPELLAKVGYSLVGGPAPA